MKKTNTYKTNKQMHKKLEWGGDKNIFNCQQTSPEAPMYLNTKIHKKFYSHFSGIMVCIKHYIVVLLLKC